MHSMTLNINDTELLFERKDSKDEYYICSVLSTRGENKMVFNVFKDELVMTQCELHFAAGHGDDVERYLEQLAETMQGIEHNYAQLEELVENGKELRKKAHEEYQEKYT